MAITIEQQDDLQLRLILTLEPEDYMTEWKKKIQEIRKGAQMKGFRKGKAPLSFIHKMYGSSLLTDVVNDRIKNDLTDYISEQKMDILGYPIPAEGVDIADLNYAAPSSLRFAFDAGLAPKLELKPLDDIVIDRIKVDIPESRIDDEIENARKRLAQLETVDEAIQEDDVVRFYADEQTEDGSDGWATEFSSQVSMLNDDLKHELIGQSKDFQLSTDIYTLEDDRTDEWVQKYILNIGENDDASSIGRNFNLNVHEVQRRALPELNDEFWPKIFGEESEYKDEASVRARIREILEQQIDEQAVNMAHYEIRNAIIEAHPMDLPENFLKRYFQLNTEQELSTEELDASYERQAEGIKWTLLEGLILENVKIEVSPEDVRQAIREEISNYFGGAADDAMITQIADNMMKEGGEHIQRKYQEAHVKKLFAALLEEVTKKERTLDYDAFLEEVKSLNEKLAA